MARGESNRGTGGYLPVLLALVVLSSGCTTRPNAPGPNDGDGVPPNGSVPTGPAGLLQYADCTEVIIPLDAPRARVDPIVPDAFTIRGLPGAGAYVNIFARECQRSLTNETITGPVSEMWGVVLVDPKNASWDPEGRIDYYFLDYATSSDALAAWVDEQGVAWKVGQFGIEKSSLPQQGQLWRWNVRAEGLEADFSHRLISEDPQSGNFSFQFWFGADELRSVKAEQFVTVDTLVNPQEIVLRGTSPLVQALTVPGFAARGTSYVNVNWTYEFQAGRFPAV